MQTTTKEAIGNVFLILPDASQPFLYSKCIRELSYLLELIYTDNQFTAFPLRNLFRKGENFFRGVCFGSNAQRYIVIGTRVRRKADLGCQPFDKALCCRHSCDTVNQRSLPPSSWRHQNGVYAVFEICFKPFNFLLSTDERGIICRYAKYTRLCNTRLCNENYNKLLNLVIDSALMESTMSIIDAESNYSFATTGSLFSQTDWTCRIISRQRDSGMRIPVPAFRTRSRPGLPW